MPDTFGNMLRDLMQTSNLSQRELASACGCTRSYLSRLMNNVQPPSSDICRTLADALNLQDTVRAQFFQRAAAAQGFSP